MSGILTRCRERLLLPIVLLAAGLMDGCAKDLALTVTFRESGGLQAGHAVVYRGVRIGEVATVAVGPDGRVIVGVWVANENARGVYREAVFSVGKPGGFLDMSGARQLDMSDRLGARTPVKNGDVIVGQEPLLQRLFGSAGSSAAELVASGRAIVADLVGLVGLLDDSPAADQLRKILEDSQEQATGLAQGQWQSFLRVRKAHIDQAAMRYREELEQQGKSAEAAEFWKRYRAWSDRLK